MTWTSSIKVAVRLRPPNTEESKTSPVVHASSQDNQITALKGYGKAQQRTTFSFDTVYSPIATQEEVFNSSLKPVIKDVLFGYQGTVFAYGQTGTGKTYTMEGDLNHPELYGVIPRSAEYLFNGLSKPEYLSYSVSISCLEIYNEELCDLLVDQENAPPFQSPMKGRHQSPMRGRNQSPMRGRDQSPMRSRDQSPMRSRDQSPMRGPRLEILEGKHGICCRGLTEKNVKTAEDVLMVLQTAQAHRKVGETKINLKSSRSHCIFTLHVTAQKKLESGKIFDTHGKLHLVDLAGSECAKAASDNNSSMSKTPNAEITHKARGLERGNINRSLLTLGRVILLLNQRSHKKNANLRVPYRDSKLTRVLQDSLGGRCLTSIIATISPSEKAIEETMSTLHYAQSASGITNKPVSSSFVKFDIGFCPSTDDSETKGVEHWYEMELKMKYLQAQLDEAQAELAKQYDGQRENMQRAERAEEDLLKVKDVLETTQENLKNSVLMLKQSKQIISTQQKELERAKIQQKKMKQNFVDQLMRGVTDLVNGHMSTLSSKQNENLKKMEKSNRAIKSSTNEVGISATYILSEVEKTSKSISEHTNEKALSDRKMKLGTQLASDSMREYDLMWNMQRKLIDDFVTESHCKVDLLTNHERRVASICASMTNEHDLTNKYVEDVRKELNDGIVRISNTANMQSDYTQKVALVSTSKQLNMLKRHCSNTTKDFSSITKGLSKTFIEDKENVIRVLDKQCLIADDLRKNVENKYGNFGNVYAKQRRTNINTGKEQMILNLKDYHDVSKKTICALEKEDSTALKENADQFAAATLRKWNALPALSERREIAYSKELSSTPSDEIIIERLEKVV